ncbi:hypothetical protein DL98DRAFT_620823 [Cadophora sp. DSE1049]|nr:hypothetical protein DL98DRAFT_620823 [Cadophora sp. DSE1049]
MPPTSGIKEAHLITTEVIQSDIPALKHPLAVVFLGSSAWAQTYRIVAKIEDGEKENYFMKVSHREDGKKALHGEFESTSSIHAIAGDFSPGPIAWGSFTSIPDAHYYICKFYHLSQDLPEPAEFCAKLAELHIKRESPNDHFGYHMITYNGNVPQENENTES